MWDIQFAGVKVPLKKSGDAAALAPALQSWDGLVQSLNNFSADFMESREQPPINARIKREKI
jgi:antitoxin VapB